MKTKSLGIFKDNVIGVDYVLTLVESAKELSKKLKEHLSKMGVNYAGYNSEQDEDKLAENPPVEIYEYQNFFILEKNNGDTVVLDGFRRLLWYNAPSSPILVRGYKEKDLTSEQILSLLVNLNHFKFYGGSSYHERGFALLLKTVFEVDITTFKDSFDAYLNSNVVKSDYGYGEYGKTKTIKNARVKERIINPFFVADMKFFEELSKTKYLCDKYFGANFYQQRIKSTKVFDVKKFIELADKHSVLQTLIETYQKVGTNKSARSQDIVNKILEIYNNLFILMEGGDVELSYAEKQKECKDMVAKLKKDKTLTKLTGNTTVYLVERVMEEYIKAGKELNFKCVVHPREYKHNSWSNEKPIILPYGIREDVKFIKMAVKNKAFGTMEMIFGIMIDGIECRIRHNYGGYDSYGKKYTQLDCGTGPNYDIDLFVNILPSEIKK